jgi:hypothetical protein
MSRALAGLLGDVGVEKPVAQVFVMEREVPFSQIALMAMTMRVYCTILPEHVTKLRIAFFGLQVLFFLTVCTRILGPRILSSMSGEKAFLGTRNGRIVPIIALMRRVLPDLLRRLGVLLIPPFQGAAP